jgi:hypothetical protein
MTSDFDIRRRRLLFRGRHGGTQEIDLIFGPFGRPRLSGCMSGTKKVAGFAAGAEAHLTGELAVCAGSCGQRASGPRGVAAVGRLGSQSCQSDRGRADVAHDARSVRVRDKRLRRLSAPGRIYPGAAAGAGGAPGSGASGWSNVCGAARSCGRTYVYRDFGPLISFG